MLDYVTRSWRGRWVTLDLGTWERAEPFLKRPFFMVVNVEAPIGARYAREKRRQPNLSLEDFIAAHDKRLYETGADLTRLIECAHMTIVNRFEGLNGLHAHLDQANLLDEERLRPGWDMYFMVSAALTLMLLLRSGEVVKGLLRGGESIKLTLDTRVARLAPVKLYEAPCWRRARAQQAYHLDRVQWHAARDGELQRGRMCAVQRTSEGRAVM